jgi:hypothetical protein
MLQPLHRTNHTHTEPDSHPPLLERGIVPVCTSHTRQLSPWCRPQNCVHQASGEHRLLSLKRQASVLAGSATIEDPNTPHNLFWKTAA